MEDFLVQREIKDNAFDYISIAEASLVLGIFHQYWVFLVYDKNQQLVYLKSQPAKNQEDDIDSGLDSIPNELTNEPMLEWNFQSLSLVASSSKTTLVPKAFYSEGLKPHYFKLNFGDRKHELVYADYVSCLESYLVYSIPESWPDTLSQFNHYYHMANPWLEGLLSQFKNQEGPVMAVDIEDPVIRVASLNEGSLHFFNTFRFHHNNDLLYYLIYTAEQLDIDPHGIPFYFSGNLFENSERFKMFYRYIRYPKLLPKPVNLSNSLKLKELPEHYFYNLLAMPLCES